MTSATDPARWSRRTVLLGTAAVAGAAVTGLTGCGTPGGPASSRTDPTAPASTSSTAGTTGHPPRSAEPSVSVFPGSVEGAKLEDSLAAHASTVLAVGTSALGKQGRVLLAAIRDQHRAHAAALRTSDPTDPATAAGATAPHPASPSPSPTGSSVRFATAIDRLLAAETKAAATHRATALRTTALAALLWGSLATSASAIAGILKAADLAGDHPDPEAATVAAVKARAPMPVVTIVPAEQQLVRQLHAIIYGYQLALGRLSGSSRDSAAAELRRHRILRDQLTARLLDRKADVPVAEPAYVPSTNPRNARTAAKLIRQMETALVPFCGLWLTATDRAGERAQALGQIGHTAGVARQWGGTLTAWPGWTYA